MPGTLWQFILCGTGGTLIALAMLVNGCATELYDPARAMPPYPHDLHTTEVLDMHVFRDGAWIEVVNSTPRSFDNLTLWINQRYAAEIDSLPAGGRVRLRALEFFDMRGETPVAGGLWRTDPPTPIRLAQIQPGPDEPMIGLITVRAEPVD